MRAGRHFCEHGNLRHSCATCREARRAKHRNVQRKEYGPPLKTGQKVPQQPWSTEGSLTTPQADAIRAIQQGRGGVVRVPASHGVARIALGTLRAWRHDTDGILLLVPSERAVEAWDELLRSKLHVPTHDIEASGRQVKDWHDLPAVRVLSPVGAARNRSGLRQHAKRMALVVDSPDLDAYADQVDVLAFPFAKKAAFVTARFGPVKTDAWPRLDALGGLVHEVRVEDGLRDGSLRPLHYTPLIHDAEGRGGRDPLAHLLERTKNKLAASGARSLILVDDVNTGRAMEEALARAGIEPRFLAATASEGMVERVARVFREGTAPVLVTTVDAPRAALGRVDHVVLVTDQLDGDAAGTRLLPLLATAIETARPLEVWDLVAATPPATRLERLRTADRIIRLATVAGRPLPPLPWLAEARPTPPCPEALYERIVALRNAPWSDVLGLIPDTLDALRATAEDPQRVDAALAAAVLADAYVASRTDAPTEVALGPVHADDDGHGPLLAPLPRFASLLSLASTFPEARRALVALRAGDLDGFVGAYAGAPILHHLVPDARLLALATLEDDAWARLPTDLDVEGVAQAADEAARRGPRSGRLDARGDVAPTEPVSPERHLETLLAQLEAEKALDEEESLHEIRRMTGTERQRAGRALLGLELLGKQRSGTGVMLRYGLPSPAPGRAGNPRLPYTELSPGSLVHLSSGDDHDPLGQGTVANVTDRIIEVVVAEDRERRAPGKDTRIDLVGNPRIYETLARAVRRVYGPGGLSAGSGRGGLRDHLLLEAREATGDVPTFRFFSPDLNPSQRAAVTRALTAAPLALVHGPPGTGKTTTLVEFIRQEVARGHRVLVTADSNAAVDNIMDAYVRRGGVGVRTGPLPSLTRDELAPLHVDRLRANAPGVPWLDRIPVVFSTHVSSGNLPEGTTFDVVVQDEASQATEAASCVSLQRAPRLVLAGDHLQLPPVVRSDEATRLGMGISLFERLFATYGATHGDLLSVQYRMHDTIARWSNETFYEGRIETAITTEPMTSATSVGLPSDHRAVFVDVTGHETRRRTSKERSAEAVWIVDHVRALLEAGADPTQVAVIAAYRAQVRLLRDLFRRAEIDEGVAIGTIDAFQGSERDLVIVSLVRSNVAGEVGFVRDPRRLNVAMTRARRHLVVVGDASTLGKDRLLAGLIGALAPWSSD